MDWNKLWKKVDKLRDKQLKRAIATLGTKNILASSNLIQLDDVLSKMPTDIVKYVIDKFIFISTSMEMRGCIIPFNTLQKARKGIIWLHPAIWDENAKDRAYYILHEVAHAYLQHKTPFDGIDRKNFNKQQAEAEKQAKRWLKNA